MTIDCATALLCIECGQTPAEADFNLLDTARKVELYGLRMHPAKDNEGVPLNLAVAHLGIMVFQNSTKINTFSWAKIRKLSFKRRKFLIKLHPEGYGYHKDTVEFCFDSRDECKNFWKKSIEHHAFFRCQSVRTIPRHKTRVISRGSSFRYSGKTQKQLLDYVRENYIKREPFERKTVSVRSTRSVGATPTTSTMNSRDLNYSRGGMSSAASASSGSHVLDISNHNLNASTRVETAEVHDDSSQSGSHSLRSPSNELSPASEGAVPPGSAPHPDRTECNGTVEHTVETSRTDQFRQTEQTNGLAADQNANDNDVIIPGSPPANTEPSVIKQPQTEIELHIDESELNTQVESGEGGRAVLGGGVRSRSVSTSSSESEDEGEQEINSEIEYVLHRRHVSEEGGEGYDEVLVASPGSNTQGNHTPGGTAHKENHSSKSTFKPDEKESQSKGKPTPLHIPIQTDSPSHFEQTIAILRQDASPDKSPVDKSPRRSPIEVVHISKLPPKNSYSSADDSLSPSLEKDILEHLKHKGEEEDKARKESESSDVFDPAEHERKPVTFSSFRAPDIVLVQPSPDLEEADLVTKTVETSDTAGEAEAGDQRSRTSSSSSSSSDETSHQPSTSFSTFKPPSIEIIAATPQPTPTREDMPPLEEERPLIDSDRSDEDLEIVVSRETTVTKEIGQSSVTTVTKTVTMETGSVPPEGSDLMTIISEVMKQEEQELSTQFKQSELPPPPPEMLVSEPAVEGSTEPPPPPPELYVTQSSPQASFDDSREDVTTDTKMEAAPGRKDSFSSSSSSDSSDQSPHEASPEPLFIRESSAEKHSSVTTETSSSSDSDSEEEGEKVEEKELRFMEKVEIIENQYLLEREEEEEEEEGHSQLRDYYMQLGQQQQLVMPPQPDLEDQCDGTKDQYESIEGEVFYDHSSDSDAAHEESPEHDHLDILEGLSPTDPMTSSVELDAIETRVTKGDQRSRNEGSEEKMVSTEPRSPGTARHIVGIQLSPEHKVVARTHVEMHDQDMFLPEDGADDQYHSTQAQVFSNPYAESFTTFYTGGSGSKSKTTQ
ncbi:dentin sialophosphoprotein-like [Lingula anatina]|uniref:Dentin sialophosphoprotein-like n=1 Tax=Lingula anatina TaxID=7574 RepID=A0A1S3K5L6_LINAN|nr:dentin sialophosphoprotein-like [Lingula anatina]|eukprot:XP_013417928.1 dentin sialophosphoprotein-like [Lingula anatina]